jgi:hypothetical protein
MKPFLHGRKALPVDPLRPANQHLTSPAPGAVHAIRPTPEVDVVKQGDKVTRIVITCTCGERIEIDCLYPAGS